MKIRYIVATIVISMFVLSGCSKGENYITQFTQESPYWLLTPTWVQDPSNPNAPKPDLNNVEIYLIDRNDNTINLSKNPDYSLTFGRYTIYSYTHADGITVDGKIATVNAATRGENDFINNMPGWFFSNVQTLVMEQGNIYSTSSQLKQQVRELTIVITLDGDAAQRIESISAHLTGAAGLLNLVTDAYSMASNVKLNFSKITMGTDAVKWSATVRLLGVVGSEQSLKGTIKFIDNNPVQMNFESSLGEKLSAFNTNKATPFSIEGNLFSKPNQAGITATIDNWQVTENGNIAIY